MKINRGSSTGVNCKWRNHDFYKSALVLGLDMGMEGIGVYLRSGPEELYAKTWKYDVPDADRLSGRRALRSGRRTRKSRRTRLHRTRLLFERHGLPWVSEEVLKRTDPFKLRYRAVTKGVSSKEALGICIRHLVMHRGYDYGSSGDGVFPWGDSDKPGAAKEWIKSSFITAQAGMDVADLIGQLDWKEKEQEDFNSLLNQRVEWSAKNNIETVLEKYYSVKRNHLKPPGRGHNFPRSLVWDHLEKICRKNGKLFGDLETFLEELGFKATKANVNHKPVFWYNRKTREEQERHWQSKVRDCPFAHRLGIQTDRKCGVNGDLAIRKWKVLEFATIRGIEITDKAIGSRRYSLSADAVEKLVEFVVQHDKALKGKSTLPSIKVGKKIITDDVKSHYSKAKEVAPRQSDFNKSFQEQLKDLLCPTIANRNKRASLSAGSAEKIYSKASASESDFEPDKILCRLKEMGFYDWRRESITDYGVYPQVEFLLGRRVKNGPRKGELSKSCAGRLRQLYRQLNEEGKLDGKECPDYCVIEVIGDPPRNSANKAEILKEQKKRRESRQKAFDKYDLTDTGVVSKRRRITLYEQQKGICPYTGTALPENALDPTLEIEHVFPESRGGLSVNDNLVLTFRDTNSLKSKKTAKEAADKVDGWSWSRMKEVTSNMRWGRRKREIFEFEPSEDQRIPEFGNITRMAQMTRQLTAEISMWMGVEKDPNEAARRIGLPNGWLVAQARRTWLDDRYVKARANLVHHLIDASVIAQIPPREGLNHVDYGGIFFTVTEFIKGGDGRIYDKRIKTEALKEFAPRIDHWLNEELDTCPVEKHRSSSKTRPLGDSTFWSQHGDKLYQRTELIKEDVKDAETLIGTLQMMGIKPKLVPSKSSIQKWLDSPKDHHFKLTNGTPLKSIWKAGGKGNFKSPLGWSAKNSETNLKEVRSLDISNDRLEIWLGYNAKKKEWVYQRRLIPNAIALRHIKQMGFYYGKDRKQKANSIFQKKPSLPETHQTLREILTGGTLLPFSHKVGEIRRGMVFKIPLNKEGAICKLPEPAFWSGWFEVSALMSTGQVELETLIYKQQDATPFKSLSRNILTQSPSSPEVISKIMNLPSPTAKAEELNLRIPINSDPPSNPNRRKQRASRPSGQTDLGI